MGVATLARFRQGVRRRHEASSTQDEHEGGPMIGSSEVQYPTSVSSAATDTRQAGCLVSIADHRSRNARRQGHRICGA